MEQTRQSHQLLTPSQLEGFSRRGFLGAGVAAASGALIPAASAQGTTTIRPYLQASTPTSIWISWITSSGTESTVLYGTSAGALTSTATGSNQSLAADYQYHLVGLTGLTPNSYYHYKVRTGSEESAVFRFRTLPPVGTNTGILRFLVVGDNQILNEPRYETILARARAKIEALYGVPLEEAIHQTLHVGDQVDVGTLQHYRYVHFKKEEPISPNLSAVTLVGNHETYSDASLTLYKAHFEYNHLKYGGITSPGGETYYSNQIGNIVFIHLNSEDTSTAQRDWVQQIVNAAKVDANVDWIVSLVHRPYQAEQYIGDISSWFRGTIAPILAQTTKHVLNIGAHHHLYARGQMRDWPVYHIISGGTAWDQFWGQSTEKDYDDVQKTIANWAWQILEFNLAARTMTVTAYAEAHPKLGFVYPSRIIDTFQRKLGLSVPAKPALTNTTAQTVQLPYTLVSGAFSTTSGETLNSTQFQVGVDSGFGTLKVDLIRDIENYFGDTGAPNYTPVNIHAGIDILRYTIATGAIGNGTYYARVRHRDTNAEWSPWSDAITFTVQGSVAVQTKLSLNKTVYAVGESITATYEGGPGIATDWIGIYRKGQNPGGPGSTQWCYVPGSSGTRVFPRDNRTSTSTLTNRIEYFAAFFTNDGYTEIAPRVPFYVGNTPVLTLPKAAFAEGETVPVGYTSGTGGSTDWIGVYHVGETPGPTPSTQWNYTALASGTMNFNNLPKGYYFAAFFVNGGYFEVAQRVFFSVGSEISSVSLPGTSFAFGTPLTISFADGPGGPKDYVGVFTAGATPGVDRLVTYIYVGGLPNGTVTLRDEIPAGAYYLALFPNDSYTVISNQYQFTITGGPTFPVIDSLRPGTNNQALIGVRVKPGTTYRLLKTRDFVEWQQIAVIQGEGLRMDIPVPADPLAEDKAFYKLVSP